ncbi:hypothetical protein COOONC_14445, partial [Cooperia oncophora]
LQTSEVVATLKELRRCTKDVTAKPQQPHKPLKSLPPVHNNPVAETFPKPCTTITRPQCRKSITSSKPVPSSKADSLSNVGNATECNPIAVAARNLKFCCQLAHGSPTAIISNFTSVDELFQSIADCFNISPDDIIFCTINTFKVDMDKLFAGTLEYSDMLFAHVKGQAVESIADCFNISPDDIIFCTINTFKVDMDKLFAGTLEYSDMLFAHVKGQAVEVELTKSEALFGLTVSDNGRCRSFIKRMKENSIASRASPALAIGQLIEKIDGINVTGMRHYEVVRILRNMPIGKT